MTGGSSSSASATFSAASSVQPPANTLRRAKSVCSSGPRSSYDHSIVARSVRWRTSASRPPLEQVETLSKAVEQLLGAEHRRPRRGELDREREVVEPPAQLLDRRRSLHAGPLAEERDSLLGHERRQRVLALAADSQDLAARHHHARDSGTRPAARTARERPRPRVRSCRARRASACRRCARRVPHAHRRSASTVSSTSAESRSGASGTQKTPFGNRSSWPAASSIEKRVFPVPPGPVTVNRRVEPKSSPASASSASRPRNDEAGTGRFVFEIVFSGGNSPSPSWNSRTGSAKSFNRWSPRSRTSIPSTNSRVARESNTCPPWPALITRAAR